MGQCLVVGQKLDRQYPNTRQFGASHALRILASINLLNYADRYVPAAVKTLFQAELHLSDFQTTLPNTGMIVVFMIFAMLFGTMSDKKVLDRRVILCGAIIFWSCATALAGLATNLVQLVALRSLVGVGEAAYGTIAPPMLSDFFLEHERNTVYGIYYLAIPVGAALGFGIGAVLGGAYGWREAFFGVGIPGILMALSVLTLNDPVQGINDDGAKAVEVRGSLISGGGDTERGSRKRKHLLGGGSSDRLTATPDGQLVSDAIPLPSSSSSSSSTSSSSSSLSSAAPASLSAWARLYVKDVCEILTNKAWFVCLLGQIMGNFALGGLAEWMSTYLQREDGADVSSAGLIVGAATVVGGIGGNVLGAKIADYYRSRGVKSAYFLVPSLFVLPATAMMLLAVNITHNLPVAVATLFLGNIFVWTYTAPISAISISVIPPRLRATSCGVLIFFQHALGDIISPPIIGAISDATGSLQTGMQITWIALLLSGLAYFVGYAFLEPLETFNAIAMNDGVDARKQVRRQSTQSNPLFLQEAPSPVSPSRGEGAEGGMDGALDGDDAEGNTSWSYGRGDEVAAATAALALELPSPTYSSLLCSNTDPIVLDGGRLVLRADVATGSGSLTSPLSP